MQIDGQSKVALDAFTAGKLEAFASERSDAKGSEEVATGFEELLARMLVSELRKSVPEGMFGGGSGSDVYSSWFDDHVARVLAEQKAFGVGELVEGSLATITPEDMVALDEAAAAGEAE